jgi:hypothetical protein
VFVVVPDPVGAGFVDSLARPGGNATGFESFEYGIGGKWLQLLKEIAPPDAARGVPGCHHQRRKRPMGSNPNRGSVVWPGGDPDQFAGRE